MNNLLSNSGLVDLRISVSEKYSPVQVLKSNKYIFMLQIEMESNGLSTTAGIILGYLVLIRIIQIDLRHEVIILCEH